MPITTIPAFPQFSQVTAFFTARSGGRSTGPFASLNLGTLTGDASETVAENWRLLADEYGIEPERVNLLKQVHSDRILKTGQAPVGRLPEGDAMYSPAGGDVLAITTADCLPVLVYDPAGSAIAAVHAGWKGASLKILEKTLYHLFSRKRMRPGSTHLAFGPCIQPGRYEVGTEVASLFPADCITEKNGSLCLDLPGANLRQALSCGIPKENITVSGECTYSDPGRFFSHRRDGIPTGRMAAVIFMKKEP
ncbi:peptidoglycan editing factor PgeF [Fibrobacterota bacterium]